MQQAELWDEVRAWQKNQDISWDKVRLTPDFLQLAHCESEELKGILALIRGGHLSKVVYIEPRPRVMQDLDWLAFACSCLHSGVAVQDKMGQNLISAEHTKVLEQLLGQTTKPGQVKNLRARSKQI